MKLFRSIIFPLLILIVLLGCQHTQQITKKIAIINSYHKGHPSSDEIVDGLLEYLPSDSFSCRVFYMDTKRHTSQQFIETQARHILDSVLSLAPDILRLQMIIR